MRYWRKITTIGGRLRLVADGWLTRYAFRVLVLEAVALIIFFLTAREYASFPVVLMVVAAVMGLAVGVRMLALLAGVLLLMAGLRYNHGGVAVAEYYVRNAYYVFLLILLRESLALIIGLVKKFTYYGDRIILFEQRAYSVSMRVLLDMARRVIHNMVQWVKSIPAQTRLRYHDGRLWVAVAAIFLAIVPFFWFKGGNGDFGGDSSRLYFYDPIHWLKSMGLFEINPNGYGIDNPNFFMVPFLMFLQLIKMVLGASGIPFLSVFNSLLLSGAFLSVYAVVTELLHRMEDKKGVRIAGVLAGLFFVCSQLVVYGWQKSLHSFHQIALYPLLFWLFLRFIHRKKWGYILIGLLITVVFSVNFSLVGAPTFFAFFPAAIVWLLVYAMMERRAKLFIGGLGFFIISFLGLHAFHLYPQIMAILTPENSIHQNLFTAGGQLNRGLAYFDGVRNMVEPIYNLVGFQQYGLYLKTSASKQLLTMLNDYGVRVLPLFFIFPLVIIGALWIRAKEAMNRQKLIVLTLLVWFLVLLYFMTASFFGTGGISFYRALFSVPGFSMFRSFYGVFAIPFMLVYAFTFGVAFYVVSAHISRRWIRGVLVASIIVLSVYGAIPMIRGSVVNVVMNDTNGVSLANRFNENFEAVLRDMRARPLAEKILTLPLVDADYQIIDGKNGGAYLGPSPIGLLAGKNVFSGLQAFDFGASTIFNQKFFFDSITRHDYRTTGRLLSMLNIGFIFNNENSFVYRDKFIGWPYSQAIWQAFPTSQSFSDFVKALGYQSFSRTGTYAMYFNPGMMQPRLFVPQRVDVVPSEKEFQDLLVHSDVWSPRWAVFEKNNMTEAIPGLVSGVIATPPNVEFRQIDSTRYEVVIRNIHGSFPLLFTQAYHEGWQLHPIPPPEDGCRGVAEAVDVSSDPTQAVRAQLEGWCAARRITTGGAEYVSQEYQGAIQNQNLPPIALGTSPALNRQYHVHANTYANAWLVDMNTYPKELMRKNQDGSADIALVLAFAPQQNFYTGIVISISSFLAILLGLLGRMVFVRLRKRNRGHEKRV